MFNDSSSRDKLTNLDDRIKLRQKVIKFIKTKLSQLLMAKITCHKNAERFKNFNLVCKISDVSIIIQYNFEFGDMVVKLRKSQDSLANHKGKTLKSTHSLKISIVYGVNFKPVVCCSIRCHPSQHWVFLAWHRHLNPKVLPIQVYHSEKHSHVKILIQST